MGTILQAVFTGLFLFLGNKYFSEYIVCQDTKTLVIAVVAQLIIAFILGFLLILVFGLLTALSKNATVFALIGFFIIIAIGVVFNAFTLFLMNKFIPGLQINGILPYVVYGFVVALIGNATSKKG